MAAFECKITLRKQHITKALETADTVKKLVAPRSGTPYKDVNVSLVYGVLAHSSDISKTPDKASIAIEDTLYRVGKRVIEHPKYGIDLLCVADLVTSLYAKRSYLNVRGNSPSNKIFETFYAMSPHPSIGWPRPAAPIAVMLTELYWRLAQEDQSLQKLSRYFSAVLSKVGAGTNIKEWNEDVFSEATMLRRYAPRHTNVLDEWTFYL